MARALAQRRTVGARVDDAAAQQEEQAVKEVEAEGGGAVDGGAHCRQGCAGRGGRETAQVRCAGADRGCAAWAEQGRSRRFGSGCASCHAGWPRPSPVMPCCARLLTTDMTCRTAGRNNTQLQWLAMKRASPHAIRLSLWTSSTQHRRHVCRSWALASLEVYESRPLVGSSAGSGKKAAFC